MAAALTSENFSEKIENGVAFVDFWAEWCGPCRMMGPVVDELAVDFDGRAGVYKLDVDENGALAAQYGVMTIPTMIVFKYGTENARFVGVQNKAALTAAIEKELS